MEKYARPDQNVVIIWSDRKIMDTSFDSGDDPSNPVITPMDEEEG